MNIKYLLIVPLSLFLLFSKDVVAQDTTQKVKENTGLATTENKPIKTRTIRTYQVSNSTGRSGDFLYRWYIQAGGGAQLLMAEDDDKGTFKSRVTLAPALTVGYRFNPIFGVRLNITGGSLHGYNDGHSGTYRFWKGKSDQFKENFAKENGFFNQFGIEEIERWDPHWNYKGWGLTGNDYLDPSFPDKQIFFNRAEGARGYHWVQGNPGKNNLYMQHIRYIATHAAVTMNLFNLFGGSDDTRKFDISMHLGPTYFHIIPHEGLDAYDGFGVNGGIQAQYHINHKLGVFLEFNGAAMPDGFDGHLGGDTFDLVGQSLLGLTYKFGRAPERRQQAVIITDELKDEISKIRADVMPGIDQLVDLQPEIDRLREQLNNLKTTETEVIDPDKLNFFLPDPVHFEINKSVIRDSEWESIDKAATYLKEHPKATVVVTGYADKDTGTRAINERLSRERSQRVADVLTSKYGIESSRITTNWRGDTVQPFYRNMLNRAVLFYIQYKQ